MSLFATTAGSDIISSSRTVKRTRPRNGFYRSVALLTTFAMLFGGLLLMPSAAAAASAVTTVNLNLREGAGAEYDVITVIPKGSTISVDGDVEAGYYPVSYNGNSGYAAVDFITIGGSAEADPDAASDSGSNDSSADAPAVSDGAPTGTAWVNVSRLNFRSGPSTSDSVIAVLENGQAVELTGQQSNGYWQANAAGTTGWLAADFVTTSGAPSTPDTGSDGDESSGDDGSDSGGDTSGSVAVGGNATGTASTTVNLYLRSGPSTSYGIVTIMPRGSTVELRGDPQAGFYPLSFNGTLGWASGDFLNMGVASPDPDPEPTPAPDSDNGSVAVGDTATGSATVTAGLNLRGGPGMDYDVRTVMPSGATVELRGDPQGSYYPLSYNGTTGWAHGDWLNIGGASPDPDPEPEPTPNPGNGSVAVGDTATGTATVTAGLNLRGGPGMDYDVRTVMPSGATVELRGDPQGAYYPLSYNGTTGWAHGDWLNIGSSQPDPEPDPEPTPNPSDGSAAVGDTATGTATVTAGLNLRRGPGLDYDVRTVMPSGATVELRGDPQGSYYPLSYNGTTGWAHGDWLNIGGTSPDPDPAPSPNPNPGNGSTPDYLFTEAAVNMRSAPTTDSSIVWVIPPGTRVGVTGAMQNGWYPVSWAHVTGYMHSDYLVESYQRDVPADKQWIVDLIYAAADRYGQPREDMLRVAQCESHLDPSAVNMDYANDNDRASGLFQFRPSTWATTPYANQDIFNAEANANAAAWMWSVGRRNEWACQ